jgi:hypothetical protein
VLVRWFSATIAIAFPGGLDLAPEAGKGLVDGCAHLGPFMAVRRGIGETFTENPAK